MPDLQKILLAEDDTLSARLVSDLLEHNGIAVELATTVAAGIQALSKGPYDALLLDMDLSDGRGTKVGEEARKMGYEGLIIFSSAYDLYDVKKETAHLGNVGYLKKPINTRKLIDALKGDYSD